jgi:iron complex outermembrane receptor protein
MTPMFNPCLFVPAFCRGVLLLISVGLLSAQTTTPDAETLELSPFHVTARAEEGYRATNTTAGSRTNERLRDVPLTVNVITADFMRDIGATDFSSLLNYVAGASDDVGGALALGNNSVVIRGLSSTFQLKNFFRWYTPSDPFNVERVEVLKGPAAVLYTQAFPGGAVNLVTKTPQTRDFQTITFRTGSNDLRSLTLDLNHDAGFAQMRVAAVDSRSATGNWFEDSRRRGLAPSVVFKPFKDTTVTAMFEYLEIENSYQGAISRYNAAIPALGVAAGDIYRAAPLDARFMGPDSSQKLFSRHAELRVEHRFTPDLSAQISYSHLSYERAVFRPSAQNFTPIVIDAGGPFVNHRWVLNLPENSFPAVQSGAVYKFATRAIDHKLFIGADWAADHFENNTRSDFVAGSVNTARTRKIYIDDPAADFSYQPGGEFRPTGQVANAINRATGYFGTLQSSYRRGLVRTMLGLRHDSYESEYLPGSTAFADPNTVPVTKGKRTNPMLGVLYTPKAWISAYALSSSSYTPTNGRDAYNRTLAPQIGDGYEFGFKTSALDGRISGSVSYYNTDITNRPESDPNPPADATNPNPMRTSGEIRSKGYDLDLLISPVPNWDTKLSLNLSDALTIASVQGNTLGQRPLNSAKESWTVFSRYTFRNTWAKGFYLGGGARHRGAPIYRYVAGTAQYGDDYTFYDALAGYAWKTKKFQARVALNVNNLEDRRVLLVPGGNPVLSPPRTISVFFSLTH